MTKKSPTTEQLLAHAIEFLAHREHTEADLRERLATTNPSGDAVERVLATLKQRGLLSDQRAADSFLRRAIRSGHGNGRIREDLEKAGLDLSVLDGLEPEEIRAATLVSARYPHASAPDAARAARWLLARGFEEDAVRTVIASHFGDGFLD